MTFYTRLFGLEAFISFSEEVPRLDLAMRHPKTLELWLGKAYICFNL